MKDEVFKIVVSKIEVFKAKALKNWNLQTKLNNFAFESNAEIRLESTLTTWWDQGQIIHWAKGGYSPGAPQDRGHHIGWL